MLNFNPYLIMPELFLAAVLIVLFLQSISEGLKDKVSWVIPAALAGAFLAAFSPTGPEFMFYESFRIDT
ncbi:MAG: NADH-quinone oxidoreductase subunit N, partial [Desulfohalobiaceae bacterium]